MTDARTRSRDALMLYGAVAAGSMAGGTLRFLVSLLTMAVAGDGFPVATLLANVAGSFAIGFYATLSGPDGRLFVGPRQRQFFMTGFCGGVTTFSMFSLETVTLAQSGRLAAAGINIALSVVFWLLAVWIGHAVATRLNRLRGT